MKVKIKTKLITPLGYFDSDFEEIDEKDILAFSDRFMKEENPSATIVRSGNKTIFIPREVAKHSIIIHESYEPEETCQEEDK